MRSYLLIPMLTSGLILAVSCTKSRPNEPVANTAEATGVAGGKGSEAESVGAIPGAASVPTPPVGPAPAPGAQVSETCVALPKLGGEPPFYVPGKNVVLTRLMKACATPQGQAGWEKETPWLAMGFPCTGGGGRIDIKGHYGNPKMVSFILGTDCTMQPNTPDTVKSIVQTAIDLPATAKLMAITPFVVQYWEVTGMTDADTGFSVDLRSGAAVDGGWARVQKKEPLRVRLFGRENAWVAGGHFYMVEADLRLTGRTQFQLEVAGVKSLSKEEIAEVKTRCEALKPSRNCADVF